MDISYRILVDKCVQWVFGSNSQLGGSEGTTFNWLGGWAQLLTQNANVKGKVTYNSNSIMAGPL